jgi:EpsI family protein
MMTLPVIAASYAFGRLTLAKTHFVPIDTFPKQIGPWRSIVDRPMSPDTHKILPGAVTIDRTYALPSGQAAELLLLTGTKNNDFHSPRICFPAQGWNLSSSRPILIGGHACSFMEASQGDQKMKVIYWWIGDYRTEQPHKNINYYMYKLLSMVQPEEDNSLFVRVIIPENSCTLQNGQKFADDIMRHTLSISASVLPVVGVRAKSRAGAELDYREYLRKYPGG